MAAEFRHESFDSLPYIDAEPTPAERAAAEELIASELPSTSTIHPLLPRLSDFTSPFLLDLFAKIEASPNSEDPIRINAIDLSRYEAVEPPSSNASMEEIKCAVEKSAISTVYLQYRQKNLAKLNETGKEEWLVGNEAVSKVLGDLEIKLASTKEQIDRLAHERQTAQSAVEGEMKGYERDWRRGVEGVLRVEVAAQQMRSSILERRRVGA